MTMAGTLASQPTHEATPNNQTPVCRLSLTWMFFS